MLTKSETLNGLWHVGLDRKYDKTYPVPGLPFPGNKEHEGRLWYKRTYLLADGEWKQASLLLKGAKFSPCVYVNGDKVSKDEGGMSPSLHLLEHPDIQPGNEITIEIELSMLCEVDERNASKVPVKDRWRSNVASCIWDSIEIIYHGEYRLDRVLPVTDYKNGELMVSSLLNKEVKSNKWDVKVEIMTDHGQVLCSNMSKVTGHQSKTMLYVKSQLESWEPTNPKVYQLRVSLMEEDVLCDQRQFNYGFKDFRVKGLGFNLNHHPVTFRSGTIVWHRFIRDLEGRTVGFDIDWLKKNILQRLKDQGANGLRMHLGNAPEELLDLCDRMGLMVQLEWIFFHGLPASKESLVHQWRQWLDQAMRHPSVCIVHPWNETEAKHLGEAYEALDEILPDYQEFVISHRDTLHIHEYWMSMFQNLGLYYDSYKDFTMPVVTDEFGGNYLDGYGNPGKYPKLESGFKRFLGHNHKKEDRLQINSFANVKVAEYWRNLGIAGFSPFCMLGSEEDGSHHFMGELKEGVPKPVLNELTAAYSPVSCLIQLWKRNYHIGEELNCQLFLYNETAKEKTINVEVRLREERRGWKLITKRLAITLPAYTSGRKMPLSMELPYIDERYIVEAEVMGVEEIKLPIISSYKIQTIKAPVIPGKMVIKVAIPTWEPEIRGFLESTGCQIVDFDHRNEFDLAILGHSTWMMLEEGSLSHEIIDRCIEDRKHVIMLEAGLQDLGNKYHKGAVMDELLWITKEKFKPQESEITVATGVKAKFRTLSEGESTIHPPQDITDLFTGIDLFSRTIWNGLRGGLIVPADDMSIHGFHSDALLEMWQAKGADPRAIRRELNYYGFEISGYYGFSTEGQNSKKGQKEIEKIREEIRFLIEDAPSLFLVLDPEGDVHVTNIAEEYRNNASGKIQKVNVLAQAGEDLTRTPVLSLEFGTGKGELLLSQVIMKGRLSNNEQPHELYAHEEDPIAGNMLMNMIHYLIK